jgi:hypothetical protein
LVGTVLLRKPIKGQGYQHAHHGQQYIKQARGGAPGSAAWSWGETPRLRWGIHATRWGKVNKVLYSTEVLTYFLNSKDIFFACAGSISALLGVYGFLLNGP